MCIRDSIECKANLKKQEKMGVARMSTTLMIDSDEEDGKLRLSVAERPGHSQSMANPFGLLGGSGAKGIAKLQNKIKDLEDKLADLK